MHASAKTRVCQGRQALKCTIGLIVGMRTLLNCQFCKGEWNALLVHQGDRENENHKWFIEIKYAANPSTAVKH
jgi:hypothetical protein